MRTDAHADVIGRRLRATTTSAEREGTGGAAEGRTEATKFTKRKGAVATRTVVTVRAEFTRTLVIVEDGEAPS